MKVKITIRKLGNQLYSADIPGLKPSCRVLGNCLEQIVQRIYEQLAGTNFENQKRVYGSMMHLDIKNEKIWIQENTTEIDIALEWMEMGIPKHDMIIGFYTLKMRQLTDFGVE